MQHQIKYLVSKSINIKIEALHTHHMGMSENLTKYMKKLQTDLVPIVDNLFKTYEGSSSQLETESREDNKISDKIFEWSVIIQ